MASLENESPPSATSVLLLIMALTLSEMFVICMCKLLAVYAEYSFYARFSGMDDLASTANVSSHPGGVRRRSQTKRSEEERTKKIEVALVTCHYISSSPNNDNTVPTVTKNGIPCEKESLPNFYADLCPVCLLVFEEGEKISRSRNCIHKFHKQCIYEWLKRNDTCPLCRRDVFTSEKDREQLSNSENGGRQFARDDFNLRIQERNLDLPWLRSGRTLDPELWTFLF